MPSRNPFLLDRFVVGLFVFCLISSVVLANQTLEGFVQAGRVLHILSIGLALLLLYSRFFLRVTPFLVVITLLFALGQFGHRPPYEAALLCLAFFLGLLTSVATSGFVLRVLVGVVAFSTVVMFLQIVGISDSLLLFSSHGRLPSGEFVPVSAEPTFLVGYNSLTATYLQGRPSGLLHSNQFSSFIIIATTAVFLGLSQLRNVPIAALLAFAGVLTLSKAVTLFIILAYILGRGRQSSAQKENCTLLARFYLIFFALYFLLFPGMVITFYLNPHVILGSIASRGIDIIVPLGFDRDYLLSLVSMMMNALSSAQDAEHITRQLIFEISGTSGVSLYAVLATYSGQLAFVGVFLLLLMMYSKKFSNSVAATLHSAYYSRGIFLVCGLAVFSLSADFSGMALFWFLLGLAISASLPRPFFLPRHRARNSPASSSSIRSHDGTA